MSTGSPWLSQPARAPLSAAILAGHDLAVDHGKEDLRARSGRRRARSSRSFPRRPGAGAKVSPAVALMNRRLAAEQIDAIGRGAWHERLWPARRLPGAPPASNGRCRSGTRRFARRRSRRSPSSRNVTANTAPKMRSGASGVQARPAVARAEQAEIGADQQMGLVLADRRRRPGRH